jgi:DNA gyrase subunit A
MMITTEGVIIQIAVGGISVYGRNTSGVKLINLDEGVTVAKIAKVREKIVDSDSPAEGEDVEDLDVLAETEAEDVEADADGDLEE